jgi:hypothetical protein
MDPPVVSLGHATQLRGELLERLAQQFQPVLSKHSSVALSLWGEAGLGKSWTAQQLLARIPCRHSILHATA